MSTANSIDTLRLKVLQVFMNTSDIGLLERAQELIRQEASSGEVVGFRPDGTPISANDLERRVQKSIEQIENGQFYTIEDGAELSKFLERKN